jgi:hypothetical protein
VGVNKTLYSHKIVEYAGVTSKHPSDGLLLCGMCTGIYVIIIMLLKCINEKFILNLLCKIKDLEVKYIYCHDDKCSVSLL